MDKFDESPAPDRRHLSRRTVLNGLGVTAVAAGLTVLGRPAAALSPGTNMTNWTPEKYQTSAFGGATAALAAATVAGSVPVGSARYSLAAGALYVNPTAGNDSSAGTAAAPLKTFQRAMQLVATGGQIVLRAGLYHVGVTKETGISQGFAGFPVSVAGITIQNYPGEAVWFDGSSTYTGWKSDAGFWSIPWKPFRRDPQYGWVYTGTYPPPANNWPALDDTANGPEWQFVDYANNPCAAWPERVWVNGKPLQQVDLLSKLSPGEFFADAYTNKLYIGEDPTGKNIQITDLQTCLGLLAVGITVRGIGFRRFAASNPQGGILKGLRASPTFENIVIEDAGASGLHLVGTASNVGPNNAIVRNVTVRRCANLGINVGSVSNVTFERVLVEACNDRQFRFAPSAGGIKMCGVRNGRVSDSIIRSNYGKGLWFDCDCSKVTVLRSDFQLNDDQDLVLELSSGALVADCTFIGAGGNSIRALNCESLEIWNCTFYGAGRSRGIGQVSNGPRIIRYEADPRAPRNESTSVGIDSRVKAKTIEPWPTAYPLGWLPRRLTVRNCVFGRGNVQSMIGNQDFRSSLNKAESWQTSGVDLNGNVYDKDPSVNMQYPWVLQNTGGGTNPAQTILRDLNGLRARGLETSSILSTSAALTDTTGRLLNQAAGDAVAVALPSNIASLIGRSTGIKRAGAWR